MTLAVALSAVSLALSAVSLAPPRTLLATWEWVEAKFGKWEGRAQGNRWFIQTDLWCHDDICNIKQLVWPTPLKVNAAYFPTCWMCSMNTHIGILLSHSKGENTPCTSVGLRKQPGQGPWCPCMRLTCDSVSGAERTLSLTVEAMLLAVARTEPATLLVVVRTEPATLLVVSATTWAACSVPFFTLQAQQDTHQECQQMFSTLSWHTWHTLSY